MSAAEMFMFVIASVAMDETVGLAALDTASLFSDDWRLNFAGDLLLLLGPVFGLDLVTGLGVLEGFG